MGLGIRRRVRQALMGLTPEEANMRRLEEEWAQVEAERAQGWHSLNGIDRWLAPRLNYENGYFVELGANNGISQSNTMYFEMKRGWRGLLIEPAMNKFIECMEKRSKNNYFECAACVSFEYSDDVVWLHYCNLMTISELSHLEIGENLEKGREFLQSSEKTFRFPARATTLDAALERARAPSEIDLLSLDVEGAELSVIAGIDHEKWRFKHIVVETSDLSSMQEALEKAGYKFEHQITKHDYYFIPFS